MKTYGSTTHIHIQYNKNITAPSNQGTIFLERMIDKIPFFSWEMIMNVLYLGK
jgi:hypothetical protein